MSAEKAREGVEQFAKTVEGFEEPLRRHLAKAFKDERALDTFIKNAVDSWDQYEPEDTRASRGWLSSLRRR